VNRFPGQTGELYRTLITYDDRQATAARACGHDVRQPGRWRPERV